MTYHERDITPTLLETLGEMPVVVLTGMRQTGKSTLIQHTKELKGRRYISLDDFAMLEAAQKDPEALLSGDEPITIDEVQKVPHLIEVIKKMVDKKRKPGQFLLSGSNNLLLLKNISESLAGRAIYLTLWPMNRREIARKIDRKPLFFTFIRTGRWDETASARPIKPAEIFHGGMPSVCLKEVKNPTIWFQGYEQTYLERDLRALSRITDLVSFRTLLHLASLRTGQLFNLSELGRDAKMNTPMVTRYVSLLEISFLIWRILPFLTNKSSRLVKSPKFYVSDSGLACYLTGFDHPDSLTEDPLWGALFETYVFQNLISLSSSQGSTAKLYFWNIQGRHEVDFIIESERKIFAIEVIGASRWSDRDFSGLRAFMAKTPRCKAGILGYNGAQIVSLREGLWAVPVNLLLA